MCYIYKGKKIFNSYFFSLTAVGVCDKLSKVLENTAEEAFFRLPIDNYGGTTAMRTKITLACTDCKQRNYDMMKNKKNDPDRLELKKYCRFCKKHTVHKETK